MPFDNFMLEGVIRELQDLRGARINKISQPDRLSIVLRLHAKDNYKLLISAHPQQARLHLSTAETVNPAKAPIFCMVLRKYLEGSRLLDIKHIPNERIAKLSFSYINELGDEDECRLIAELMGKHSNIILVNKAGIIIDGIRRYTHAVSRYRQVLPNEEYRQPPPQNKPPITGQKQEAIYERLLASEQKSLDKALLNSFAGLSPFAARDMMQKAGLAACSIEEMGIYELERLHKIAQAYGRELSPCVLKQDGNASDIYCLLPELWQDQELQHFDGLNEACDFFYSRLRKEESFDAQKRELLKVIHSFSDKAGRKLSAQQEELATAQNGDEWKQKGDLLAANLWQAEKGMASIELADFYHDNEPISIELNPALTPQENLSRFYRRYNKLKSAAKEIIKQVEATQLEYDYLLSIESSAEDALDSADITAIKEELSEGGYLKAQSKQKQKPQGLPPMEFTSSDGITILVGRNNKQNDMLTLKMAAKDDIWLHTQKIPGSHVIIRCGGKPVPERTLQEAAALAVLHSKAKGGGKAPVDYTEVSQVKKPNGAKPGMVIYFKQQTLMAEAGTPKQFDN